MSSQPSIFISYRRDDSEDVAVHIYDRLTDHFGAESVFFDIDTIPLGVDFEEYIDASVSQCKVFLAIIGKSWLTVTDDDGVSRLKSEADRVRLEIESALKRKLPVIPLLVSRAKMPKKSELPESLQKLASFNGAQIRPGKDFRKDVDELIKGIETHFCGLSSLDSSSESPSGPSKPRLQHFSFEVVTVDSWGQEQERRQASAEHFVEDLGDGVTLDMVRIPGGSFLMGSPKDEPMRYDREGPQHHIDISEFFLGRYPVTQAQWQVIAGLKGVTRELRANPSSFNGANRPVDSVSWDQSAEFCARLTRLLGIHYSLPSEAQWEYACRSGTTTPFHFCGTLTSDIANYRATVTYGQGPKGNFRKQTTDVGQFPANGFGLCDMHGNVSEWCLDYCYENYTGAPKDGSAWMPEDNALLRARRGGSWDAAPGDCRSACRYFYDPDYQDYRFGFRVVCEVRGL